MNLWLDDCRDPTDHGFYDFKWVRTATDAITELSTGTVKIASLDHDLGDCSEPTGYDVVCWMEANNVWPSDGVTVHSRNPVGAARMRCVIERHYSELLGST